MRAGRAIALALLTQLIVAATSAAEDAAQVVRINGAPTVARAGQRQPLRRGDDVRVGDVIETDENAKVKVLLADDSVLDIGPQTRVLLQAFILTPGRREASLDILVGKFKLAVSKFLTGDTRYDIRTPSAVAGVRGTVLWGDTARDIICALDGTIDVAARGGDATPVRLSAGECANQMKAGRTERLTPSAADVATYLKEVTLE